LEKAKEGGFKRLVSFGGAYSNHLPALAFAAASSGFSSRAIIRGDKLETLNPVLSLCSLYGTKLEFILPRIFEK